MVPAGLCAHRAIGRAPSSRQAGTATAGPPTTRGAQQPLPTHAYQVATRASVLTLVSLVSKAQVAVRLNEQRCWRQPSSSSSLPIALSAFRNTAGDRMPSQVGDPAQQTSAIDLPRKPAPIQPEEAGGLDQVRVEAIPQLKSAMPGGRPGRLREARRTCAVPASPRLPARNNRFLRVRGQARATRRCCKRRERCAGGGTGHLPGRGKRLTATGET